MNRILAFVVFTLALWAAWLIGTMFRIFVPFDGMAFLFVCLSSSQLIMLALRNKDSAALKTLLAMQALVNAVFLVPAILEANQAATRVILAFVTLAFLVAGYVVAFRLRRPALR